MMPGMDGWAVLSALKADPELADIPVIMLTIVDDRNLGYALGASDYLTKPIDRERLIAVLQSSTGATVPVLVVDDDVDGPAAPAAHAGAGGLHGGRGGRTGARPSSGCATCRPSVILLDLMMPEMDGFEFVGRVPAPRGLARHPDRRRSPPRT